MRHTSPRTVLAAALVLLAALASPAAAQAPARVVTVNDTLRSPEVLPDRRVTIRIYAPKATDVSVWGDWIAQGRGTGGKLTRDDQGVWSLTVGPLVPDVYSYILTVDGVRTVDPKNAWIKQGISSIDNVFEVQGTATAFMDPAPVAHGTVHVAWYPSKTLGTMRSMHVYTPPGYERGVTRYPVLYLLHGAGDDDSGWSTIGRANFILDNLIASGRARPMIVVMPNGSMPRPTTPAAAGTGMNPAQARFRAELLDDVIPFAERTFRTLTTPQNRAIAGLSMGGGQTLAVVGTNLDRFAYVAVWSAGVGADSTVTATWRRNNTSLLQPGRVNATTRLFYIAAGAQDQALPAARNLAQIFDAAGVRHQFHESEGGHTWINWRRYLEDYAPQLFR